MTRSSVTMSFILLLSLIVVGILVTLSTFVDAKCLCSVSKNGEYCGVDLNKLNNKNDCPKKMFYCGNSNRDKEAVLLVNCPQGKECDIKTFLSNACLKNIKCSCPKELQSGQTYCGSQLEGNDCSPNVTFTCPYLSVIFHPSPVDACIYGCDKGACLPGPDAKHMEQGSKEVSNRAELVSLTSDKSDSDDYWFQVLGLCFQQNPSHFGLEFPSWSYSNFEYLDSGTYSHVIKAITPENNIPVVFKIIKVVQRITLTRLSELSFKGFELYSDVYQEIVITKMLSNLHQTVCDQHGYEYQTHTYPRIYSTRIVHGEIPNYFIIRKYDETIPKVKPVERFDDLFGVPKEHLVIVMKYGGESLWCLMQTAYKVTSTGVVGISTDQLLSVCYQVTIALAVAEAVYEFEHRDLHVCNILVKPTKKEYVTFVLRSVVYRVKTHGVKACIIDATFSRLRLGSNVYFTDLSNRLKATAANPNPDSQEVAYQQMYKQIIDKWRDWFPETNLFWLKYFYNEIYTSEAFVADCKESAKNTLKQLMHIITDYKNLADFVNHIFRQAGDEVGQRWPKSSLRATDGVNSSSSGNVLRTSSSQRSTQR